MARAAAPCIIQSAIARSNAVQEPVWPRIALDIPRRHPARQRQPYRQRGVPRPEGVKLWGVQDASIPQQDFVPPPPPAVPYGRVALAGVAATLAGTVIIAWPASETTSPFALMQTTVTVSAPLPAPVTQPAAPTVPVVATPTPRVQDAVPTLVAETPTLGPAIAPRMTPPLRRASASPQMAPPAPANGDFVCADCASIALRLDGLTVTLHGNSAWQAGAADSIAAMGAAAVLTQHSAISVASPQIRVYRAQDFAIAQALADRFGAVLVDVTWLSDTAPARIDLLLPQDAAFSH